MAVRDPASAPRAVLEHAAQEVGRRVKEERRVEGVKEERRKDGRKEGREGG